MEFHVTFLGQEGCIHSQPGGDAFAHPTLWACHTLPCLGQTWSSEQHRGWSSCVVDSVSAEGFFLPGSQSGFSPQLAALWPSRLAGHLRIFRWEGIRGQQSPLSCTVLLLHGAQGLLGLGWWWALLWVNVKLLCCLVKGVGGRFRSDVGEFKDSVSVGSNLAQVYLWFFPFKQDLQRISVLCWSTPGFQPWGRVRVSTEMDFRNFVQYLLIHYFIPGILLGTRKMEWIRPSIFPLGSHRFIREGKCVSIWIQW